MDHDLAVIRTQLAQSEKDYRDALARGDMEAIKEFGAVVLSLRDSVKSLEAAASADQEAISDALARFTEELKLQNDLAASQVGIENSELVKALADILSGQIVGRGLRGSPARPRSRAERLRRSLSLILKRKGGG